MLLHVSCMVAPPTSCCGHECFVRPWRPWESAEQLVEQTSGHAWCDAEHCRVALCCDHAVLHATCSKAPAVQAGRVAVYGDSNCLDSSHRRSSCQAMLLKLIRWATKVPISSG